MSELRHTPGPWGAEQYVSNSIEIHSEAPEAAGGSYVCEITNPETPSDETEWANAKLIAAAPDMLAALLARKNFDEHWLRTEEGLGDAEIEHVLAGIEKQEAAAITKAAPWPPPSPRPRRGVERV